MRWIKKRLYKSGYRPSPQSMWYSSSLAWYWGMHDARKKEK